MRPPIDPEVGAVLADLPGITDSLRIEQVPAVREARKAVRLTDDDLRRGGAIEFAELTVPGPAGAPDIALLVCKPAGMAAPAAGVFFIHGGGMMYGDNRSALYVLLDWIEATGVVVVSTEYRLAPEHKYPASAEDCYAALTWTAAHAAELGIDPARLLIAGISAGGGLAAAVALMARDRGGPALIGQTLICPMLDDRNRTPSSHDCDGDVPWNRSSNLVGWRALLGDAQGGPDVSPYAAPARATDLSGLPAAYLDVGSVETFRDETLDYAARIWRGRSCRAARMARRLPRLRAHGTERSDLRGRAADADRLGPQAAPRPFVALCNRADKDLLHPAGAGDARVPLCQR
jgi:acetyl esterase/lipase